MTWILVLLEETPWATLAGWTWTSRAAHSRMQSVDFSFVFLSNCFLEFPSSEFMGNFCFFWGAVSWGFPIGPSGKESIPIQVDVRDVGSVSRLERSHGAGHRNPLQYSCLENPMDRGAWRAMVHRVAKSQIWLKQLSMHAHSYQAQQQIFWFVIVIVESLSCVQLFVTPWTAACQASLSFTISRSLLRFMSIESMMPSNHLILCCPLFLLPPVFPSIRVFSTE